ATATLLHHKTKITQRYATPALTNIGEPVLNATGNCASCRWHSIVMSERLPAPLNDEANQDAEV
ncbi:MAG: hypothetical protein K2I19_03905, partial [Muribaculaceae bacterium]|nr:hypothetical protein [Muribaculaceae bacterium]